MYKRLEKYLTAVMTHFKPDVYCWDVVNEAISGLDSETFCTQSDWYKTCGTGFVEKAFRLAHKINPDVKLFYNDYDMVNPVKRQKVYNMLSALLKKGVPFNGIGIQGHWNMPDFNPSEIQKTIDLFASLGLEIQITELDLSIYRHGPRLINQTMTKQPFTTYVENEQAEQYKQIFDIFLQNKGKITSVTFWGVSR